MLQLLLQRYSFYCNVTAFTAMLQLLLQCYSFYCNVTAFTAMLQLLLQRYSFYCNVTAFTAMLQLLLLLAACKRQEAVKARQIPDAVYTVLSS